jgi:YidC/Oxa1 family membrane protein insertase
MPDQRNLVLAIALSIAILIGFHYFVERPRIEQARQQAAQQTPAELSNLPNVNVATATATATAAERDRAAVIAESERLPIDNPRVHGTMGVKGSRLDDLTLDDYFITVERKDQVTLLSPAGTRFPYYAEFGWVPAERSVKVPDADTVWTPSGGPLSPASPVTFRWDNGAGLIFERTVAVDANYMFAVTQRVINRGTEAVTLLPYSLISRHGTPKTEGFYILHEGPVGVLGGKLQEWGYSDLAEKKTVEQTSTGGWIGITDKYWLVSIIPEQSDTVKARFLHQAEAGRDRYQVDLLGETKRVEPGASVEATTRLFAGAKEVNILDAYEAQYGIKNFDKAVDFGWFYFITKPFFHGLHWVARQVGNFGIAILIFTVFLRLLMFPLANKSYKEMSRMKKLQPQMMEIREKFGEDKAKMQQEMMALYKREKVNPVSGCLPIVLQIPIFFALYKVLFVTIEMRHAPFFGWIQDLSAPDPTTVFNLFGLIPWQPPELLHLGVWPLIMGATMFLQQKMNPAPADPVQAKVLLFMPILFTFMLGSFPAGLVIYWAWSNVLSIAQQWVIMRQMGVKVT